MSFGEIIVGMGISLLLIVVITSVFIQSDGTWKKKRAYVRVRVDPKAKFTDPPDPPEEAAFFDDMVWFFLILIIGLGMAIFLHYL